MFLNTTKLADQYLSQTYSDIIKGDFVGAKANAKFAIKLDTSYFEAHNALGICCCLDMDYAGASVCFNASQKIKPNQTTANLNPTAYALIIQGVMTRYDEYLAVLDQEIIELYDDIFKKDSNNV